MESRKPFNHKMHKGRISEQDSFKWVIIAEQMYKCMLCIGVEGKKESSDQ
jgi:hypothetical protein